MRDGCAVAVTQSSPLFASANSSQTILKRPCGFNVWLTQWGPSKNGNAGFVSPGRLPVNLLSSSVWGGVTVLPAVTLVPALAPALLISLDGTTCMWCTLWSIMSGRRSTRQ